MKPNPTYKGKWYAPTIDNPEYKGEWAPRKIANPGYFEDNEPIKNLEKIVSRLLYSNPFVRSKSPCRAVLASSSGP